MTLVSELEGAQLDYWVAKIVGKSDGRDWGIVFNPSECIIYDGEDEVRYSPSTDWSQGGPIIERENIAFGYKTNTGYARAYILHREKNESITQYGSTKLIAAMRCYVASKFGEEVES